MNALFLYRKRLLSGIVDIIILFGLMISPSFTAEASSQVSKMLLYSEMGSDAEINSPTIVTEKVSGWEGGAAVRESGPGNVTYENGYTGQAARLNGSLNNDEKLIFAASNFDFSDLDDDGGRFDFWLRFNVDPHTYAGNLFILRTEPYPPVLTIEIYGSNPYMVFEFYGNRNNPKTNYRFLTYTGGWDKWLNWKKDEWHLVTLIWKRNQDTGNAEMHLYIDGTQEGCPVNNCNDYLGILPELTAWNEVVFGNYYNLAIDFSIDELKSFSSTAISTPSDSTPPFPPTGLEVK